MKHFLKKHWILAIIGALIVAGTAFGIFQKSGEPAGQLIKVQKGEIAEEVSVTGRIKPMQDVKLAFEKSGKIANIYAKVGDEIKAGEYLMDLEAGDIDAQLNQAAAAVDVAQAQLWQYQAAVESQKAKLAELQRGSRKEDLQIAEVKLENAKKSLLDTQKNLQQVKEKANIDLANIYNDVTDTLNAAYANTEDAVRNKTSAVVITENGGQTYKVPINICNFEAESDIVNTRRNLEVQLVQWSRELKALTDMSSSAQLDQDLQKAKEYTANAKKLIDRISEVLANPCVASNSIYRTDINTARTNINAALASINAQQQKITSQKNTNTNAISTAEAKITETQNAVSAAETDFSAKKAGTAQEQIDFQIAQVKQAEASANAQYAQIRSAQAALQNQQAQLEKTIIYSPIDGVVTQFDGKVGQIASPNTTLVTVISQGDFEIQANIPEVDITEIKIGNPVKISIDALPGETFQGKVVEIDPAETIIDGVVNFKIKILFEKADERFRSGLTANLDIQTKIKKDVLILPQNAILENDEGTFVRKIIDGETRDIPVEVGIRSQDGNVEIVLGVIEGEEVLDIGAKSQE